MRRYHRILLVIFIIGAFGISSFTHAKTSTFQLTPPQNIQISQGENGVLLTWKKPRRKFLSYRIYRSRKAGELGQIIKKLNKNKLSFLDSNISPNTEYFYAIKTYRNGQESRRRKQISLKTGPNISLSAPIEPTVPNSPQKPIPSNIKLLVILTDKIVVMNEGAQIGGFQSVEKDEVEKVFFGETNSVKSYFKENSYGKINLEGEITNAQFGFDGRPMEDIINALDPTVDFSQYNYFFFVTLRAGECTGGGSLGRTDQYTTQEGIIMVGSGAGTIQCLRDFYDSTKIIEIIHELGHAFDLKHTGTWLKNPSTECSDNIPLGNLPKSACYSTYGSTPMGTTRGDLFVFQRNKLAAPFSAPALTITENGDYWVHSFRDNPSLQYYEELRVPAVNGYYSLEFRHDITNEIKNGVMINFIPNDNESFFGPLLNSGIEELLVRPEVYSLHTSEPFPTFSFTDSLRNISITILRTDENRALLRIKIN